MRQKTVRRTAAFVALAVVLLTLGAAVMGAARADECATPAARLSLHQSC
ncbi:MAG: hypothetical protein QOE45_1225 [Frankiaceae bacterium]|jgi:hypothetical protein|nr:hypothetical protein [Frankiaceae bacterium]